MTTAEPDPSPTQPEAPLGPSDFDGHRGFASWSPEQRLDWLGQVVAFVAEFRSAVRSAPARGEHAKG